MMETCPDKNRFSLSRQSAVLGSVIIFLIFLVCGEGFCLGWKDTLVRHLPDASFASLETDSSGKRIRHCPYRDAEGNIDYGQLIYVLGVFSDEGWMDSGEREKARKLLTAYYEQYQKEIMKEGLQEPLNINTASLTRLVMLPGIGPVLAVRLAEFREENGPYRRIEDIQKVRGIGKGTFRGLRFYIRTESSPPD